MSQQTEKENSGAVPRPHPESITVIRLSGNRYVSDAAGEGKPNATTFLRVRVSDSFKEFRGRAAWALDCLVTSGDAGCTPLEHVGPRWSHYIFLLRRAGLTVETIQERHGGTYAGNHGRYVLRDSVEVIERRTVADGAREAA